MVYNPRFSMKYFGLDQTVPADDCTKCGKLVPLKVILDDEHGVCVYCEGERVLLLGDLEVRRVEDIYRIIEVVHVVQMDRLEARVIVEALLRDLKATDGK